MKLPPSVNLAYSNLQPEFQTAFLREYKQQAKSKFKAYLAWLFLGWHYLYMGKVGMQFAFWFTAGGFFIWWFIDFFRLSGLIDEMNAITAREIMTQVKSLAAPSQNPQRP